MSPPQSSGKIPGKSPGVPRVTALALRMGRYEAEQALSRPLQNVFGFGRGAAKILARTADLNTRTAEDLINGEHLPSGLTFLKLLTTVPEFAAEVRRLTGQHADLDPMLERDLVRVQQTFQRWQAQREALSEDRGRADAAAQRAGGLAHGSGAAPHGPGGESNALAPEADDESSRA